MKLKSDKIHQKSINLGCISNILYLFLCVKAACDVFWGNAYLVTNLVIIFGCLICAIYLNYKKKKVLNEDVNNVSTRRLTLEAILMVIGLIAVYLYVEKGKLNLMFALPPTFVIAYSGNSTQKLNVVEGYLKKKTRKRVVFEKVIYVLAWMYFLYYAIMIKYYG